MKMSKADKTRETLLLAGEELMGWKGIEAISVRDINAKANQKNTSAIRYYFDNKQGLLRAILDHRMVHLDELRQAALEDLRADQADEDIALVDLVRAQVLPLAQAVLGDPAWRNYVLLLSQIVSAQGAAYEDLWHEKYDKHSVLLIKMMRSKTANIDDALWLQRVHDMITFCIGSLCERTFKMQSTSVEQKLDDDRYLSHLISTATLMLAAPES
jgi:AcrR family transcriptional regulator